MVVLCHCSRTAKDVTHCLKERPTQNLGFQSVCWFMLGVVLYALLHVVQDSCACLPLCLIRAGRLLGAAQAATNQSAPVSHRLHLQPGLCHSRSCANLGRHPQGHLFHAEVSTRHALPAVLLATPNLV